MVDAQNLERIGKELLQALGEDVNREGLRETPRRFANMWKEFVEYQPGNHDTTFEAVTTDQLVIVSGLRVWSFCEHHLLPFYTDVTIAYLASTKVLGLSKFARIAHMYAHRLQVQERLVHQIADKVQQLVESDSVAVIGHGVHMCMVMRGIKTPGVMTTSVLRGEFQQRTDLKLELFSASHRGASPGIF